MASRYEHRLRRTMIAMDVRLGKQEPLSKADLRFLATRLHPSLPIAQWARVVGRLLVELTRGD